LILPLRRYAPFVKGDNILAAVRPLLDVPGLVNASV